MKIGIDQIVEIEGHHSEVEVSMDKIIGEDHNMSIIIEMTLQGQFQRYAKLQRSKF